MDATWILVRLYLSSVLIDCQRQAFFDLSPRCWPLSLSNPDPTTRGSGAIFERQSTGKGTPWNGEENVRGGTSVGDAPASARTRRISRHVTLGTTVTNFGGVLKFCSPLLRTKDCFVA